MQKVEGSSPFIRFNKRPRVSPATHHLPRHLTCHGAQHEYTQLGAAFWRKPDERTATGDIGGPLLEVSSHAGSAWATVRPSLARLPQLWRIGFERVEYFGRLWVQLV